MFVMNKEIAINVLLHVLCCTYCTSLRVTCNTTFSDLKHSITKVICPANCLTHSHELCGDGVYSRGPICLAAIQDQRIDNSGGFVTVYRASGKMQYSGDQRNGVFSRSCGPSDVSYTFRMTCSTDGNSETEVTQVVCPPNCRRSHVFPCGGDFFHQNTSVCGAALNRNLIQVSGRSVVTFYKKTFGKPFNTQASCWKSSETFTFNKSINECDLGHRCENNSTCVDGIMEYFCVCQNGYYGKFCQAKKEIYVWLTHGNELYFLDFLRSSTSAEGIETLCDRGWTVFQIRDNPSVNFNRSWSEYKRGFGNFSSSFWWGLQNLYLNTKNGNCSLHIDLWDFNGNHTFASYGSFSVGSEFTKYRLQIADYQTYSTAVNAMANPKKLGQFPFAYNNGKNFTTYDSDNDLNPNGNCALERFGGWWFNDCGRSGLNGPVVKKPRGYAYVRWQGVEDGFFAWRKTMMKFRCNYNSL